MWTCPECARQGQVRVLRANVSSALVFAVLFTVIMTGWQVAKAVARGQLPLTLRSELVETPLRFAIVYVGWLWFRHYPHVPRPRTRYWLWLLAKFAAIVVAAVIVGIALDAIWPPPG